MKKRLKGKKYIGLMILLLLMLLIHKNIFLYADDLYYRRDANIGLGYLKEFALKQLNINGRVWVHVLLFCILRYDIFLFRIINPIIITLTALLIGRVAMGKSSTDKKILIATSCAGVFFISLPIEIAHTTIYYAACSLNYLYPTAITILYAYMFYEDYRLNSSKYKSKWSIILLAFLSGSSTQQAGMIGIGFTVMITLYFKIYKKEKLQRGIIPYYLGVFTGYAFILYGSIKRMLFEKSVGNEMNISATVVKLLKTNIFSIPISIYVIILCLCCILWLHHYALDSNKFINISLIILLSLGVFGYAYIILYRKYNVENGLRFYIIGFALLYLISLLYVSFLVALKEDYPFLMFCTINSIGAQIMLIAADSRFAGTYKIMFPSLLLMSIFIVYSFLKFFSNRLGILFVLPLCMSLTVFHQNYNGYKGASYVQNFNLKAIEEYHKSENKSILKLKKASPTTYGYNVSNWNSMPYFMKQCYKINEDTIIEYYK
ncbi:hypothetical protein GCM10008905_25780 [Clostridium malenominatum]|uniref:Glycosyltransferase RgtA/B/C/D-like domain-containing protein n=1 Tax=Clostridium malenominatum TaxID=1539 RepID=A0ABN1J3N1_9CLOT